MRKPLPGHLAFREAVKNKTNKNEKKKNSNLSITVFNAADRNRTGTGITTHGILSPGRLPVPPRRHMIATIYCYKMGPTGLEPVTLCL